jgi:hypothetical protein
MLTEELLFEWLFQRHGYYNAFYLPKGSSLLSDDKLVFLGLRYWLGSDCSKVRQDFSIMEWIGRNKSSG